MTKHESGVDDFSQIGNIDRLIHEPGRLMIMAYLSVVESADFLFLKRQTGFTWGNLSAHISKLEKAGYIEVTKEFVEKKPHTVLHLTEVGRNAFDKYRESMTSIFGDISTS
jgi:DNA-binding MarR family transcriptional regulator